MCAKIPFHLNKIDHIVQISEYWMEQNVTVLVGEVLESGYHWTGPVENDAVS